MPQRNHKFPLVFIGFLFFLIFSCQKELSFQNGKPSVGALQKDTSGNCLPISVAGTYVAGKILGDTNYVEVGVNVNGAGTYLISTNVINGYSFKATGNFSSAGSFQVKLIASGKPVAAGTNNFIVSYDSGSCTVSVNVRDSIHSTSPATFTFQGAPNACMNAKLIGSFVKDILLDTSAKVNINLVVTIPGTYTISTNTVNGYSFTGSGSVSAAGLHTISLTASGKPINLGID